MLGIRGWRCEGFGYWHKQADGMVKCRAATKSGYRTDSWMCLSPCCALLWASCHATVRARCSCVQQSNVPFPCWLCRTLWPPYRGAGQEEVPGDSQERGEDDNAEGAEGYSAKVLTRSIASLSSCVLQYTCNSTLYTLGYRARFGPSF